MPPTPAPDAPPARGNGPRGIQSIELGYRILTAIQEGPDAVPLKTIAARAAMSPSAVHNYLASFIRTGMVCTDVRGQYRLGPSLAALGMTAARHVDQFELIRGKAAALSERTGLGVAVLIWGAQGPIILFNKADPRNRMFDLRNGPVNMLTTGGGHLFATLLPREVTLPVARHERPQLSAADCDALLDAIGQRVRAAGYAELMLDTLPGYGAVSVPVWDARDAVAYALTVTAPAELIDKDPGGEHIVALQETARELSRLLGASPARWA